MPRSLLCLWPGSVCSVPDEGSASEDRSTSSSVEDKDSGLFLLQKDSERRAILYKILKEEQNKVASNLQDCIAQVISLWLSFFHVHRKITNQVVLFLSWKLINEGPWIVPFNYLSLISETCNCVSHLLLIEWIATTNFCLLMGSCFLEGQVWGIWCGVQGLRLVGFFHVFCFGF